MVIPGKNPPLSSLGAGVASGSIETTDRIGKTRSVAPGLNTERCPSEKEDTVGDGGPSLLPEKMLMLDCRGDMPVDL